MSEPIVSDEQLAEWERLDKEATAGEWHIWRGVQFVGGGEDICIGRGDDWLANMDHRQPRCAQILDNGHNADECDICTIDSSEIDREQLANAELIVSYRSAVPALIAEVRRLRETVSNIRRENTTLRGMVAKQMPCHYCGQSDMSKCPHGFPGCPLMDDLMAAELERDANAEAELGRELIEWAANGTNWLYCCGSLGCECMFCNVEAFNDGNERVCQHKPDCLHVRALAARRLQQGEK